MQLRRNGHSREVQKPYSSVYTDNSMEFGRACKDLSWNQRNSTPHRSETNDIAERAVRRVKEGTSAVLLQSGLDERWCADSMECYGFMRNKISYLIGRRCRNAVSPAYRAWLEPSVFSSFLLAFFENFFVLFVIWIDKINSSQS